MAEAHPVAQETTSAGAPTSRIPRVRTWDGTPALLSDGYTFITKRCRAHGSDIFETRLMLEKVFCMQGAEAAEVFYTHDRFTRKGAMPTPMLKLLQDRGSVQLLDGEAHRWRKRMFMSLMSAAAIRGLSDLTADLWQARLGVWETMDQVVLLDEIQHVLCRAACQWAGVPLAEPKAHRRTREFAAMIDGAGSIGPRNWRGLLLRARSERWARQVVEQVRTGSLDVADTSAAYVIAWHRNPDGQLLDVKTAAVELLNVLRPTVAIAHFVVFAGLALHEHPAWRQRLQAGDDRNLEPFAQEVRRFYPFFPVVGGRVREAFDWRGRHFAKGTWMLLDLYGTNHDPRTWEEPEAFQPERFHGWGESPYNFVPQGGGDHHDTHRCPGEWVTIELIKTTVRLLTTAMAYDVPEQDLRIDLSRMPAIPKSRFVIENVRRTR